MRIQILPKTWAVIQMSSNKDGGNLRGKVLDLKGRLYMELDEEVVDELIRRGTDLGDLESVHRVIVGAYKSHHGD